MGVGKQVMLNGDFLVILQFLDLHAVQERFVNSVRYSAAEGRSVVILLNFPNRNGVDNGVALQFARKDF